MWMYHMLTCWFFQFRPDTCAMFPGRFPNIPDPMWNFGWNPQTMGLHGQFCGGDQLSQQSQAQAQAQISALQRQNAMLNQHLHSQAQSHIINNLQQLLPFHQPPHLAHPPPASFQSTPQPSAPPAPTATPATQSGPSTSFNPDEILQQMKSTVESSIQAMVEKTQERQVHSIPPPPIPVEIPPQPASHPTSTSQHPPPQPRSSRSSRSHHHRSSSRRRDKRPVSTHRSPRRRHSSRRPRRSSRHRSNSRDASRHRSNSPRRDRESSITLRSASPHRRDRREQAMDYHQPPDYSSNKPLLQASQWWTHQQSTDYTTSKDNSYYPEQSPSDKWQSWGWKDYYKNPSSSHHSTGVDYKKSSHRHNQPHDSATKPLTAFSSTQQAPSRPKKKKLVLSGDDQTQVAVNVPTGHMLGSEEWNLVFDIQIECQRLRRFHMSCNPNQQRQWRLRSSTALWPHWNRRALRSQRDRKESDQPTFQHQPTSWLWLGETLPHRTSLHKHACTDYSTPRNQSHWNATSLQKLSKSHLGASPWHYHWNIAIHLAGRKDQTGQLILQQRLQQMWYAHLWGFLPWQRDLQERYLSWMGGQRTHGYCPKKRERTTRRDRGGDVSRCMPTYCLQSWRKWNGTTFRGWERIGDNIREIHDCPQQSCWPQVHRTDWSGRIYHKQWTTRNRPVTIALTEASMHVLRIATQDVGTTISQRISWQMRGLYH